ncbi:DNA polymerase III subunit gamma/tau [Amphibacillus jilinensis]|uniref:DNA polymerase III subunit gamma/tau n=1 Tax=Amphibacillus jilinensis TaxID=1216008 RepID=UPI00030123CA|nr:DNA polymerase III subunit gamma/tau [Amphibacillus jilinensis]
MSYQALYRVWRPQTFVDVVGQSHITRTLQNAIVQNKFSHAYLFSGPRGTGKTSAAKIFAKTINCKHAPTKEPCGTCEACVGIQTGAIADVMEIDAASNNGVEQIRDIRDKVKYAPSAVSYKVYIIDEVHMLSIGAFNALLKTLEEPPKHVIFILATTEPHKIPLTIISRCQRFDFKRITQQTIVSRMQSIMEKEEVDVTQEAYHAIALAAEGGMRDALSLLDQAISYSQETVQLDDVLAITGSVSQANLMRLVEALQNNDVRLALTLVDQFIQEGKDPARLIHDMIYILRDLLLYQTAPALENTMERALVDEHFRSVATQLAATWIQQTIGELNQCQQDMKWSNSPKIFIEITLLKITEQKNDAQSEGSHHEQFLQLTEKLDKLEKELTQLKQHGVTTNQGTEGNATTVKKRVVPSKNHYKVPFERIRQVLAQAEKTHLKQIHSQWATFMQMLKQQNAPAHATLQEAKPSAASEDSLIIAFRYEIHCSLALDHKQTIESLLLELIGKNIIIIPIPEVNWQEVRQDFIEKQRQQHQEQDVEETEEDKIITEARKLVGDDLLEIHDK